MKMQSFPQTPRSADWPSGAEASFTPGLCVLSALTAAELGEALPPAQAHGFYLAIGRRLAALEMLEGVTDTVSLRQRTNAFWHVLGWGEVDIEAGADGILVRHRGAPVTISGATGPHWRAALLALLEGAYDTWFRTLGSGPALHTTAQWKGDVAELRHGR